MQILNILLALVILITFASSLATEAEYNVTILTKSSGVSILRTSYIPRPDRGLYLCRKPEWKDECIYGVPTSALGLGPDGRYICHTMPSSWADQWFVSFGPDKDITCMAYVKNDCKGFEMKLEFPGWNYLPGPGFAFGVEGGGYRTYRCLPRR